MPETDEEKMSYEFFEQEYTADIGFKARATTPEKMFVAAAEATMNVMVDDLEKIENKVIQKLEIKAESLEMLLFDFLQELIYHKDAEQLMLRVPEVSITEQDDIFILSSEAYGEQLNVSKHELNVDVKAVTMHHYRVEKIDDGWQTTVVLDI